MYKPEPYTLEQALFNFWRRVDKLPSGCWEWTGRLSIGGYGMYRLKRWNLNYAHRVAWVLVANNVIPEGLQLDHLCRNRKCVNPSHLELVTNYENIMRGENFTAKQKAQTHCIHGHLFDANNTYINPVTGERHCRACARAYQRELRANGILNPRTRSYSRVSSNGRKHAKKAS
jgi:hypothetical protein